jgi:pantetheine-phosphate adenylyltransferase
MVNRGAQRKATAMTSQSPRTAVYTGSFDPITLGHVNVIERGARLVDRLIVGIGVNVEKESLFSLEERIELVQRTTEHLLNVEVRTFSGLAVAFVRDCEARVMIRGVRPLTDIAAEFTMMLANRELDPDIETVFLMADQRLAHVSSTLIKQIAPLADDERLSSFVPWAVIRSLREKLARQALAQR